MSRVFDAAVLWVIKEEGGLHDDPNDPGGLTNMGVALAEHPEMTADQIRHLTIGQAIEIYETKYWRPVSGDDLPPYAAYVAFDCGVNQGTGEARLLLQQVARVTQDGIIGPATLAAIGGMKPFDFLASFTAARDIRYSASPRWKDYADGWVKRATLAALEASRYVP